MKILFCFGLVLLVGWILLFYITGKQNITYGDVTHTNLTKGYAILAVLFAHVGQYAGVNGIEFSGAVGVSLFLLLSGYGLAISYAKVGLQRFWRKKIQKVLLPYIVVQVLYMLIVGTSYNFTEIVLDFTLFESLHPFGWYLSYIFICYIIFWITHRFIYQSTPRMIAITVLFFIWFLIKSTISVDETSFLQPRQMLAFPLGVFLGSVQIVREKCSAYKWYIWVLFIVIGIGIYGFEHSGIFNVNNTPAIVFNFVSLGTCVIAAIGIFGLIHRFSILHNKGMGWISMISYEIYLIHGYLMVIVANHTNILLDSVAFLACNIGLAVVLHLCMNALLSIYRGGRGLKC